MPRKIDQKDKEQLIAPAIVRAVRAEQLLAKLRLLPLADWPKELDAIQRDLMLAIGAVERVRALSILMLEGEADGL